MDEDSPDPHSERLKEAMDEPCCILTDNGSYQSESTMSLRNVAERLAERIGQTVHPVSLLHSTKINPEELGGVSADIFESFIQKKRTEGLNRFLMIPLFFGPSAAIKEYLPQRVAALREEGWGELEVKVAPRIDSHTPAVGKAKPATEC
ncbi:hypothetical protein OVA24_17570 [Luteolibacter sp. SL250]|uniref:hypothetical protein n=1 Tax=Luteolibacter sp. SL250 TaxID=2995170 RepID=UPI00226E71F5|nr:hypothetical protein [Luteolibacter sp. SL250]WAC19039.1 hypothetical protein OVA24_17570 [Luteolibacter sp. SL250]